MRFLPGIAHLETKLIHRSVQRYLPPVRPSGVVAKSSNVASLSRIYLVFATFTLQVCSWDAASGLLGAVRLAFAKSPTGATVATLTQNSFGNLDGASIDLSGHVFAVMLLWLFAQDKTKTLSEQVHRLRFQGCKDGLWTTKDGTCLALLPSEGLLRTIVVFCRSS